MNEGMKVRVRLRHGPASTCQSAFPGCPRREGASLALHVSREGNRANMSSSVRRGNDRDPACGQSPQEFPFGDPTSTMTVTAADRRALWGTHDPLIGKHARPGAVRAAASKHRPAAEPRQSTQSDPGTVRRFRVQPRDSSVFRVQSRDSSVLPCPTPGPFSAPVSDPETVQCSRVRPRDRSMLPSPTPRPFNAPESDPETVQCSRVRPRDRSMLPRPFNAPESDPETVQCSRDRSMLPSPTPRPFGAPEWAVDGPAVRAARPPDARRRPAPVVTETTGDDTPPEAVALPRPATRNPGDSASP